VRVGRFLKMLMRRLGIIETIQKGAHRDKGGTHKKLSNDILAFLDITDRLEVLSFKNRELRAGFSSASTDLAEKIIVSKRK